MTAAVAVVADDCDTANVGINSILVSVLCNSVFDSISDCVSINISGSACNSFTFWVWVWDWAVVVAVAGGFCKVRISSNPSAISKLR